LGIAEASFQPKAEINRKLKSFIEMVLAIFITLVIVASAASIGYLLPRQLDRNLGASEAFAMRLLAGFGLLGLTLFLVGNWYWNTKVVWTVLLLPIAISALWAIRRYPPAGLRRTRPASGKPIPWLLLCAGILLLHAVSGLAIPLGDSGSDEISYHFLGPVVWQRTHIVRPVLDHSHTAFPENIEMLFGAGMLLGNERVPGLMGVVFAALLVIQIGGLARRLGASSGTAWMAMAVAATMPVVIDTAERGFVDVPYASFCLAAARLVFAFAGLSGILFAGLFAGLAAGTKYTGLMNLALIVIASLAWPGANEPFRQRLRKSALLSLMALAVCSPWYVRNALVLGTPIYPPPRVLATYLHPKAFPMDAVQKFQDYIRERGKGYGRGPMEFLLLPFNFTYRPAAFHGAGGIGLVPLAFLPIALAVLRRNREAQLWMVWSVLFTLAWFVTQQEARFLIPVLGLAASLGAIGAGYLWATRRPITRILTAGIAGLSIGYGLLTHVATAGERIESVFSNQIETRREAIIPVKEAFEFLNSSPDVKAVLVLNRFLPCYYLHKPYIKVRGQYWEQPIASVSDARAALAQIRSLHVTHILDVQGIWGTSFELSGIPNPHSLVFSSPAARIYRVVEP
jgi:hypothetical protein